MAMRASGTIGIYINTRSPTVIPLAAKPPANAATWDFNSEYVVLLFLLVIGLS